MGSEGRVWMHIEDALRATEKALGDAEWDGLDTTYLKQELVSLRLAQRVGEKYVTNW